MRGSMSRASRRDVSRQMGVSLLRAAIAAARSGSVDRCGGAGAQAQVVGGSYRNSVGTRAGIGVGGREASNRISRTVSPLDDNRAELAAGSLRHR